MQALPLKLLQQGGSIRDDFYVLLLEPYKSDRRTAPEPPPSVKIIGHEENELEEIFQSEGR
jgi:hypothetical protein